MSRWVAVTTALAQGTPSFPADRNPLPSRTNREKGFLKQNVQQSNSFQAYCGLCFYISFFSKFNIPQREQKGILTSGFIRMSGGGWVCPLPWQWPWCVGDHTLVRLPSNRKAPSAKWRMVSLHLGNNRKTPQRNHNVFLAFILFSLSQLPSNAKLSCQVRGWAASPSPDLRSLFTSFAQSHIQTPATGPA